jgi:hypothetical protein
MSKVALSGNASGTGTFTIASPNSNTDRTLTLPDATGTVLTTATAGVPVNGPAFSAYPTSSSQSPTSNTFTKVTLGSEVFDTNSNFANSTFTPAVAGYYQINCTVGMNSTVARLIVSLYKNGAEYSRGVDIQSNSAAASFSVTVFMNGSTDYLDLYTYNSTGGVAINSAFTAFSGFLARSAT